MKSQSRNNLKELSKGRWRNLSSQIDPDLKEAGIDLIQRNTCSSRASDSGTGFGFDYAVEAEHHGGDIRGACEFQMQILRTLEPDFRM